MLEHTQNKIHIMTIGRIENYLAWMHKHDAVPQYQNIY